MGGGGGGGGGTVQVFSLVRPPAAMSPFMDVDRKVDLIPDAVPLRCLRAACQGMPHIAHPQLAPLLEGPIR